MSRIVMAVVFVLGFASLLWAKQPDTSLGPFSNDKNLNHAFGGPKFFAQLSCSTTSAVTGTDFTKGQQYLITCNSDTFIDFGSSSVTATASEIYRAAGADLYFTATDFTRVACITETGTSKCSITEMRGATTVTP